MGPQDAQPVIQFGWAHSVFSLAQPRFVVALREMHVQIDAVLAGQGRRPLDVVRAAGEGGVDAEQPPGLRIIPVRPGKLHILGEQRSSPVST